MKHISYKSLLILLCFSANSITATSTVTTKTALDYLLECPECKDVTELLEEEAARGCCNSCNNCSSCNTCSSCCKRGDASIKKGSCCNKCNNCSSCKTCSSCCKSINLDDSGEDFDENIDEIAVSQDRVTKQEATEKAEELELEMLIKRKKMNNFVPKVGSRSVRG